MTALNTASDLPSLLVVALVLGFRHGFDADHLAAIDAMARFNVLDRPRLARRTGLWFSIGHGAVVITVAFLAAVLARGWQAPAWLAPFGAWTSIGVLAVLGTVNLTMGWRAKPDSVVAFVGWRSACFARFMNVTGAAPIFGIGALFALSFDTLSQAALMAATGTALQGALAAAALALTFILGMLITDGINGMWVARLLQRADARAAVASRVMCVGVASVSLGTAVLGAAVRLSSALGAWAASHDAFFAGLVIALVLSSFVAGAGLTGALARPAPFDPRLFEG